MNKIDFQNGFLCGLVAMGIPVGGEGGSGESGVPDPTTIDIINYDAYRGDIGDAVSYLNDKEFSPVLSTNSKGVPESGIVALASFNLQDWDAPPGEGAEAIMRITVDDRVIYEGDVYQYFGEDGALRIMKAFKYETSFEIAAKRLNMSDGMALELYNTIIITNH